MNNGDGTFRDETASRLPQADNNDPWIKFIQIVDINGDGHLDIATTVLAATATPPFPLNDGTGAFARVSVAAGKLHPFVHALVDVAGDGGRDFLTSASATPTP